MLYLPKSPATKHLAVVGVVLTLVAAGCQTSPWSSKNVAGPSSILGKPDAESPATAVPTDADVNSVPTPRQIMADVRELGSVNPAAQAALLQELEKADPDIWPSVVQNFRSRMAYGDQAYRQEMLAAASQTPATPNATPPNATPSNATPSYPTQPGLRYADGNPYYANQPIPAHANTFLPANQPVTPTTYPSSSQPSPYPYPQQPYAPGLNNAYPGNTPGGYPNPDQNYSTPSPGPNAPPQTLPGYPYSSTTPGSSESTGSEVLLTSYEMPMAEEEDSLKPLEGAEQLQACPATDWETSLTASIETLQKKLESTKEGDADAASKLDQLRLRFLLLAAGRSAEAMEPIPGESEAMADFWAGQMFGLSTLLDDRKASNPTLRNALAKHKLSESLDHLGKTADLVVHNLSFCRVVDGFANTEPFEKYEFQSGQQVILYAELDNLKYEEAVEGYRTSLQMGYKIFDASDRLVADEQSGCSEECSPVLRRDFYVNQILRLPERLYPGHHVLKLTVEDRLGQKYGESLVEFEVK